MSLVFPDLPDRSRRVFCNRTLNLRAIRAIGYDMDYTLVHYHVDVWEKRAYQHVRARLKDQGWPVEDLRFDGSLVSRALIIDTELGNVVKADRFGYVKAAAHGTRMLEFPELRERYLRTLVDLRDRRWEFLNTLFSISIGCLYGQCVDLLDQGRLPPGIGYADLYRELQTALDLTHLEGALKDEIISDPSAFVDVDPDLPATLLDQRAAGKKLVLITNSGWRYTNAMMSWVFEQQLRLSSWRALWDMVIVEAKKPGFFLGDAPIYEVINDDGDLRPLHPSALSAGDGRLYYGGNAALVEQTLGLEGADILYVGDHIFADVHASKRTVRWRTALVLRELEEDVRAIESQRGDQAQLASLMREKTALEERLAWLRLDALRRRTERERIIDGPAEDVDAEISALRQEVMEVDQQVSPLAGAAATVPHPRWGAIMRAGIDKSHIARQIERYADIYLSRVSNLLWATPYAYFRSPKSSLPHDT